jgi:hypothetical protein
MIVLGALIARAKGWKPSGAFRLGFWAWPVNLAALSYGVLAFVNMVWPRAPQDPWYRNYGMIVGTVVVFATGLVYAVVFRPYNHGDAPAGDAHLNLGQQGRTQATPHRLAVAPASGPLESETQG